MLVCDNITSSTHALANRSAAFAALSRFVTYPFRSIRHARLHDDVLCAAIRALVDRLTIAQSRYLIPTTTEQYLAFCNKHGLRPSMLQAKGPHGEIAAHWIGSPDADTLIVYFHGGGYTQPATAGCFIYLERLVRDINSDKTCRSVAVLMPAYTLAPEATHPTQLSQGATVLSHLIHDCSRPPSSIFLFGDSSGGNLLLSILSHALHPHPQVPALSLEQPLGGMLLLSPWTSFHTDYPSFEANKTLDILTPLALRRWSAMFLGTTGPAVPESGPRPIYGDTWTEASLNAASWWHGSHNVVSDIFVWSGGFEVFRDPIRELKQHLTTGWVDGGADPDRLVFVETAQEAHIQPIIDAVHANTNSTKGDAQVAIEAWVKARLQV